jgi:GTP cyclohydrolase IA
LFGPTRSFSGYQLDPRLLLERTFEEIRGYDEMAMLKDIRFVSCCEHHRLPVIGKKVAYGIPSELGRRQDFQARACCAEMSAAFTDSGKTSGRDRLAIEEVLKTRGVGIVTQANHSCMRLRGVSVTGAIMRCSSLMGDIRVDPSPHVEFLRLSGQ